MGIFADRCEALVDPSTGRALSGESRDRAKLDRKWPRCNNRVRKAARFCNKCGSPAPGGWWRCPSCRKWVGNDSHFCPHCNQPLYPESRADIAGGVWRKQAGVFAQRFEIGDIKRLLSQDLQVQAGTIALLLDGGQFKGILKAGQHNPDSLARAINHFGNPPPRSVVLLDAGDVVLPLDLDGFHTAEGLPIGFYGELIVRFGGENRDALAFLEQRFKDAQALTYAELLSPFMADVRHSVDAMCVKSQADDLVRDPERRLRLEDDLGRYLRESLARCGVELVRVSAAEFRGTEYEKLAEKLGEVETTRRELEYDQRMRELLTRDRMAEFKSEQDLAEYQETLAHEYGIASVKRDRERVELLTAWRRRDEIDELRHTFTLASEKTDHEVGTKTTWDEYQRDRHVKDAESHVRVRDIEFSQKKKETEWAKDLERGETEWAMGLRERKDAHKAEMRDRDAKRRREMSELELLADVEDPEQRKVLLDAMVTKSQAGMTPEQILATAAAKSPAAAEALARMKESGEEKYRELLAEMKALYRDAGDRVDRNLKTTLEPAVEAAKRKDGSSTYVKQV